MLKVVVDRGNAPARTGIGVFTSSLVDALRKEAREGIAVEEARTSREGSNMRPLRRLVYLWNLRRAARDGFGGADVVHFTNVYVPPRRRGVGYVGSIHDLDPIMLRDAHTARYSTYFDTVVRRTAVHAHVVHVDSHAVGREVQDVLGVPGERIAVCGIGLSTEFLRHAAACPESVPAVPTVLYVGQLSRKKNVAWLVRTVVRGVRTGALPGLRLHVCGGPGYGFEAITTAIRDAGDVVTWYRSPSLPDLVAHYKGCSAVVLPSLREGFGLPLLEAMHCGKPILASRIPSSMEVAGDAAEYFDLGDEEGFFAALTSVLRVGGGDTRRDAARRQLERYAWGALAGKYLDAYMSADARS